MKGVRIWSFSIQYFHAFRLILEIPTQREILLLIVIAKLKYDFLLIVLIFRTTITFLMFKINNDLVLHEDEIFHFFT